MKADFITRWCSAFCILGLDYILPLWEFMGLNISDNIKSQLLPLIREAYIQCQQEQDYLSAYVLVEITLKKITANIGKDVSIEIKTWCDKYFLNYRDKCNRRYEWRRFIATMGFHYNGILNKPETYALNWNHERYHYLLNLIKNQYALPFLDYEDIMDELEERFNETKCSDWDKQVLSKIRQEEGDILIISTLITEIALNFHLSKFFELLEKEFTKDEIKSIIDFVKKKSGKDCIPLVLEEQGYK